MKFKAPLSGLRVHVAEIVVVACVFIVGLIIWLAVFELGLRIKVPFLRLGELSAFETLTILIVMIPLQLVVLPVLVLGLLRLWRDG